MSFQEDLDRCRTRLLVMVDAGVQVSVAAGVLGLSRSRAYEILRAVGRGRGARTVITEEHRKSVVAVFAESGSISRAASISGLSHDAARRILVAAGRVPAKGPRQGPRDRAAAKARFLELLGQGRSAAWAAREVGVNERTARDWRLGVRKSGRRRIYPDGTVVDSATGTRYTTSMTRAVDPAESPADGRYLTLQDRLVIADGLIAKRTLTAIATDIGKAVSSVSREVRSRRIEGVYLPYQAHEAAAAARARPKVSKLTVHTALRTEVEQGLERKLSPEQISNRLKRDFPDDESMRVSHETIYQALYFQARGGLKREVQTALRTGRTRRVPHRAPNQRRQRFIDPMIMISDRPAEAADRAVPGHWEGDLIMGEKNQSAIGTLVERATRYTMLVHLPDGHDAEHVRDQLIATISTLPAHLRGSLTWDQGAEMARHKQFAMATDMAVYFCDPASPWQRGTNENTNGLLRQYFPKGTDLSRYGPEDLEHVAQELNARPRKTLGWETPAERLRDLLLTT